MTETIGPSPDEMGMTKPEKQQAPKKDKDDVKPGEKWREYLKATGNPMLKIMQEEAKVELGLSDVDPKKLQQLSTEMSIATLNDIKKVTETGWRDLIDSRKEDSEKFSSIEQQFKKFGNVPELKDVELSFGVGDTVKAPEAEDSDKECDWQVVNAESGHYLLERKGENNRYNHVICSENELKGWN